MPSPSPQTSGRGAKARICIHCGRGFRRTEHLERHVRTRKYRWSRNVWDGEIENADPGIPDTKEKPFICFCGAAFTRRDLLKRHTRISHQDGLVSPESQAGSMLKTGLQAAPQGPAPASAAISPQYDASARPVGSIPEPPAVHHWTGPQPDHAEYLTPTQPSGIMTAGAPNPTPPTDGPPGMHDPAMLQAAQLLIPGDYQAPSQFHTFEEETFMY